MVNSFAEEKDCVSEYLPKLTKTEAHIRSLHPKTFDLFLSCPFHISKIATATHESSHLIDTGISFSVIKIYLVQHEKRFPRFKGIVGFSIHRPNGVEYEIPYLELPAANKVFKAMKFQDSEYKKLRTQTSFEQYYDVYFQNWRDGKLNSNLSSYSFAYGFPMEINGYLYGARSEIDHSMEDTSDLSGLLYLIASTEMYIKGLKLYYPLKFEDLKKAKKLKTVFSVILKESFALIKEKVSEEKIKNDPELLRIAKFVFDENHVVYLNYVLTDQDQNALKGFNLD